MQKPYLDERRQALEEEYFFKRIASCSTGFALPKRCWPRTDTT